MFVNGAEIGSDGRVLMSTVAPSASAESSGGSLYNSLTGALFVHESPPLAFYGGQGFNGSGQLCVDTVGAPAYYNNGQAYSAAGQLCVDEGAAVVQYCNGRPMSAAGKLCTTGAKDVVVSNKMFHFSDGPFAAGNYISSVGQKAVGGAIVVQFSCKFVAGAAGDYCVATISAAQDDIVYIAWSPANNCFKCYVQNETGGFGYDYSGVITPPSVLTYYRFTVVAGGNYKWEQSPDGVAWVQINTGVGPTSFPTYSCNLNIGPPGQYFDAGAFSWNGDLGRIQVWNDAAMTRPLFDCDPNQYSSGTNFVSGTDTYNILGNPTIS